MKTKFYILCLLLPGIAPVAQAQQASTNRYALVIGAQNYSALPALRHSLNDARIMTTKLQSKGFQVEALYDPKSKREIRDAITRYYNVMRDKVGAVGIIFYAGHGMQYEGDNYIIPTTASLQNPGDLDDQCVKMNTVMAVLKSANKSLNILLLDACRSLPSFTRDTDQGLTRMEAPQGSIIVFAAQAGKVASDGTGQNGLFTSKLIQVIDEPNLNITDVFKKVKQEVYAESRETQLPSVEDNSIGGDFYFTRGANNAAVSTAPSVVVKEERSALFDYGYGPSAATLTLCSQVWILKNLNVSTFANGESVPEAKTAEEWATASDEQQPAWCYLNNDPINGQFSGRLYNWFAVNDPRGLAPKGWHIPNSTEWSRLIDCADGPLTLGISGPARLRFNSGEFSTPGEDGGWWTSSKASLSNKHSYIRGKVGTGVSTGLETFALYYFNGSVPNNGISKGVGLYVRCIKD